MNTLITIPSTNAILNHTQPQFVLSTAHDYLTDESCGTNTLQFTQLSSVHYDKMISLHTVTRNQIQM